MWGKIFTHRRRRRMYDDDAAAVFCDVCKILTMHAHTNIMKGRWDESWVFLFHDIFCIKNGLWKVYICKEMNIAVNSSHAAVEKSRFYHPFNFIFIFSRLSELSLVSMCPSHLILAFYRLTLLSKHLNKHWRLWQVTFLSLNLLYLHPST